MSDLEEQRRKAEELKRKILEQKKKGEAPPLREQVPQPDSTIPKQENHGGVQTQGTTPTAQPSQQDQTRSATINPIQAYTNALRQALADGVISKDEDVLLSTLRKTLGISDDIHHKILHTLHVEIYVQALKAAWADGKVTEDDVERLEKLRELFRITADEHLQLEKMVRQQLLKKSQ